MYQKLLKAADEYARDLGSCFQIISRVVAIEDDRDEHDNTTKLVESVSLGISAYRRRSYTIEQ